MKRGPNKNTQSGSAPPEVQRHGAIPIPNQRRQPEDVTLEWTRLDWADYRDPSLIIKVKEEEEQLRRNPKLKLSDKYTQKRLAATPAESILAKNMAEALRNAREQAEAEERKKEQEEEAAQLSPESPRKEVVQPLEDQDDELDFSSEEGEDSCGYEDIVELFSGIEFDEPKVVVAHPHPHPHPKPRFTPGFDAGKVPVSRSAPAALQTEQILKNSNRK